LELKSIMKSFNQYITEVFDKPYNWSGGNVAKGSITPENDGVPEDYTFRTSNDGSIEVTANHFWIDLDRQLGGMKIKKTGHTIAIEFSKDGSYGMSGEGDAMRIMATVLDIMKSIIKKHEPMTLIFSADKTQDTAGHRGREKTGRSGAYGAIVKRFAGKVGYKSDTKDSNKKVEWQLTKK
jgi:hypothetical protein